MVAATACSLSKPLAVDPSSTRPWNGRLESVPVCQLLCGSIAGSGVPISGTQVLTARHLLSGTIIAVNGVPAHFVVVNHGERGEEYSEDWACVELSSPLVDCGALQSVGLVPPAVEGEELLVIGYTGGSVGAALIGPEAHKVVVPLTVVEAPSWLGSPQPELVYLQGTQSSTHFGLSGAPTVRWVPARGSWEFVGLYMGTLQRSFLWWHQSVHVVLRDPRLSTQGTH